MALSSYPALNWPVVHDHFHGFIPIPPAAATEAPHQLEMPASAAAFPSYSNNAGAALSVVYNNRHSDVVKADPLFFNKGYFDYGITGDAQPADDYSCISSSYPDCYNYYSNYSTVDDLLDPAETYFSSPAADPLSLAGCYDMNYGDYHLQQQLSSGPGILGLHDYNEDAYADQFYQRQLPAAQPPKRHRPCYFDLPGNLLFPPGDTCPPAQLPVLHAIDGVSSNMTKAEEYIEHTRPRPRRVSAQSLAARERRKRISDKTQELGKLIPGGSKMNTAEMLQSAFNYVKFLQSQVQILQLMASSNPSQEDDLAEKPEKEEDEAEKGSSSPSLLRLVASPTVQEKLYKEESCIIPRSLAKALVHSHPHLPDLHQLL
ncbi:uncharacterized protein LOC116208914 [Punica granatum]|uniref:Uncharacterized protein LOC116208914 n=1 Tax=Punica granatum TaxID=22663 RepID=A0A6P8DLX6_PUNGR|nr:uncharacterized protein LOC116208914 [Punica granatum]